MRSLTSSVLVLLGLMAGCGPADPPRAKAPPQPPQVTVSRQETPRQEPESRVKPRSERTAVVPVAADTTATRWKVVGVHDGDTVRCVDADNVQHKVRLVGIDAPETSQAFGTKSREHLAALVMGRMVAVERHGEDRYGRTLGRIEADGQDVNRQMVAAGMAWHYVRYDDDPRLADAEREARTAKRGLWADPHAVPPWEWRAGEREQTRKPASR